MDSDLRKALRQRRLLLDGAMGTEIQRHGLKEADFHCEAIGERSKALAGNNDLLVLSRPDVIKGIHTSYLQAGADIIETCTFSSNRISQREYECADLCNELNLAGARLAREAADEAEAKDGRKRFVAGSVGPSTRLLSLDDCEITFDELAEAYEEQMTALIQGEVDAILIETVVDTLNAKAALYAAEKAMERAGRRVELMLSVSPSDGSGRLLCGQALEDFLVAISHANLLSIGLNCSFGAAAMAQAAKILSDNRCENHPFVSLHPNAGLPDGMGEYPDIPTEMASQLEPLIQRGLLDILGGCCGTTPQHIRCMRSLLDASENIPRAQAVPSEKMEGVFVNVGERCNVAGSRRFLRLIKENNLEEALTVARKQVDAGAMMLDINMDDGLLDSVAEMERFLRLASGDPVVSSVPFMIDSSDFEVLKKGLKCVSCRPVVNSLSLKEGETQFLSKALEVKRLGGRVVVMCFDEEGQAVDYEHKIKIAERSYRLLTEKVGFQPEDIIIDPNILTVATGIAEHANYALDYVKAAEWIKQNLTGATVSGGLSNLSFAFRGNNPLREAIHAVFLYHASQRGMGMAIMNPESRTGYEDVDPELRKAIEDVLFDKRDEEALERLTSLASKAIESAQTGSEKEIVHQEIPLEQRLRDAIISGNPASLEEDLTIAIKQGQTALQLISGPLMEGMDEVGRRFGEGKMFLPQVVKTASAMKAAVAILRPYMENTDAEEAGDYAATVVIATVKGDVHDIGKNIVSIILRCNRFKVIDLGVMVPPQEIVETAKREGADFVCLSGLITPSLEMMRQTLEAMQQSALSVPVMIGGATTSPMHTAVKLAPIYDGPVVHVSDASRNPVVAHRLLNEASCYQFVEDLKKQQALLRNAFANSQKKPTEKRVEQRSEKPHQKASVLNQKTLHILPVAELIPLIDWLYFFHAWKVEAQSPEGMALKKDALKELEHLIEDNSFNLSGLTAFYPAKVSKDAISLEGIELTTPRGRNGFSLCDYLNEDGDEVGLFAATVSESFMKRIEECRAQGDEYRAMLLQTLGDRLAEAASERLHQLSGWKGIRPAVGYPSLPDQKAIFAIDKLLDLSSIGIKLTETGAMYPPSSVAGLYISDPEATYNSAL